MWRAAAPYAAVGLGSALGALARHHVSVALVEAMGAGFPWGTLSVNVAGSFLIGVLAAVVEPDGCLKASRALRLFALTGFCGGFTTFSLFNLETLLLFGRGSYGVAAVNLGASVTAWLAAAWCGGRAGVWLNRALQPTTESKNGSD